jgi:FtsZ-interacting cell division protein YlmF
MNLPATEATPIFIIEPESQSEIMSALQKLKERYTVVLNLARLETPLARQAADLMAGCSCAIDGQAIWIGEQTYLYTPSNVNVNVNN